MVLLEEMGRMNGKKSVARQARKMSPSVKQTSESQKSLLITTYTAAMKAKDIMVRDTPNNGTANLRELITRVRSPNCAHIRETDINIALYIAMLSKITNALNMSLFSKVVRPWSGSKSFNPPGIVKAAAKVTVAIRVDTSKRVFTLSFQYSMLYGSVFADFSPSNFGFFVSIPFPAPADFSAVHVSRYIQQKKLSSRPC